MKILLNKNKQHISHTDIMILIFIVGLILGIIFANVFRKIYISEINIINDYFTNKLINMNIEYSGLLKFIIFSRFKYFLILWLLSITILGLPAIFFYTTYGGFMVGFILSIATMKYGFMGIILFLAYIFPQGVIYIPIIIISLIRAYSMCHRMYYSKNKSIISKKNIALEYLITVLILSILIFIGCIAETYINPNVLQGFLKVF